MGRRQKMNFMHLNDINISGETLSVESMVANSESTLWIGALSFEERCYAALMEVHKLKQKFKKGIILEYTTNVYPQNEERAKRKYNNEVISNLGKSIFDNDLQKENIGIYSFIELQYFIEEIFKKNEFDLYIIDITCMSKLHTLALAAAISS